VLVSVDEQDPATLTTKAYEVPFPLLSDPEVKVHALYRVINPMDEAGVKRLAGLGIDLERWSKRKHHKIAVPSMFLIDEGGTVRFAHAAHDHRTRPALGPLLERLTALRKDR